MAATKMIKSALGADSYGALYRCTGDQGGLCNNEYRSANRLSTQGRER
jgi:hypothetical protein